MTLTNSILLSEGIQIILDSLHYATWSVIIGISISVIISILIIFCIRSYCVHRALNPISYIIGISLSIFLSCQIIPILTSIIVKWQIREIECYIEEDLIQSEQDKNIRDDTNNQVKTIDTIIERKPFLKIYIDKISLSEGIHTSEITTQILQKLNQKTNRYIFKLILISLLEISLAVYFLIIINRKNKERRRKRYSKPNRKSRYDRPGKGYRRMK